MYDELYVQSAYIGCEMINLLGCASGISANIILRPLFSTPYTPRTARMHIWANESLISPSVTHPISAVTPKTKG